MFLRASGQLGEFGGAPLCASRGTHAATNSAARKPGITGFLVRMPSSSLPLTLRRRAVVLLAHFFQPGRFAAADLIHLRRLIGGSAMPVRDARRREQGFTGTQFTDSLATRLG